MDYNRQILNALDSLNTKTPAAPATAANQADLLVDTGRLTGDDLTPAAINASSQNENVLVAAQGSGVKVYAYAIELCPAGDVTVSLKSSAGGATIYGPVALLANQPYSIMIPMRTIAAGALVLNLSAAVQVGGGLLYRTGA